MQTVNIHEAKTNLSRLLEAVERGEEIVIARAGQPIATLNAYKAPRNKIAPPGSMKGQFWMSEDFNDPIDDLFDVFKDDGRAADSPHDVSSTSSVLRAQVVAAPSTQPTFQTKRKIATVVKPK